MAIDLAKVNEKAPELVSLVKGSVVSLEKAGLKGMKASVALCLDYSGSMYSRYQSGEVQRLAERALALATQLDDDGAIDVFAFDSSAIYLGQLTLDNYKGRINSMLQGRRMGTTNYSAAFRAVKDHYLPMEEAQPRRGGLGSLFGKKSVAQHSAVLDTPVFVIFETDGSPDSRRDAENDMKDLSKYPIFWKFFSVGRESIGFLEKLDDMPGRVIDNADYQPIGDVEGISDSRLFDLMLEEYLGWYQEAKQKHIIAS